MLDRTSLQRARSSGMGAPMPDITLARDAHLHDRLASAGAKDPDRWSWGSLASARSAMALGIPLAFADTPSGDIVSG